MGRHSEENKQIPLFISLLFYDNYIRSMAFLHVEPQNAFAILTMMTTVSSAGRPALFSYVQKYNGTFVSRFTLFSALKVSKHIYV